MQPQATTFTIHAFFRVKQRLHLSLAEIAGLLDAGAMVPLGQEGRSNRVRLLFYSPRDDAYFIAVRDAVSGEVITILPETYSRIPLADDVTQSAKRLALEANLVSTSHVPDRTDFNAGLPIFEVVLHFQNEVGQPRRVTIGRVCAAKFVYAVRRIISDRDLHATLLRERDACVEREGGSAVQCYLQQLEGPRRARNLRFIDLDRLHITDSTMPDPGAAED